MLGELLGEHTKDLLEWHNWEIVIPDGLTMGSDEADFYGKALRGCCMSCGHLIGRRGEDEADNTMVVVMSIGIVMIFCQGACFTDMQIHGYLAEQITDLVERVKFRGQGGPSEDVRG